MGIEYDDLRESAQNGDLISISGSGLVSLIIRGTTFSSFSHTGLLVWQGDHLMVSEYKEGGIGYRKSPASMVIQNELEKGNEPWYSEAPPEVRANPEIIEYLSDAHRDGKYSYGALAFVLYAQLLRELNKPWMPEWYKQHLRNRLRAVAESDAMVCSLWAAYCYRQCGVYVRFQLTGIWSLFSEFISTAKSPQTTNPGKFKSFISDLM